MVQAKSINTEQAAMQQEEKAKLKAMKQEAHKKREADAQAAQAVKNAAKKAAAEQRDLEQAAQQAARDVASTAKKAAHEQKTKEQVALANKKKKEKQQRQVQVELEAKKTRLAKLATNATLTLDAASILACVTEKYGPQLTKVSLDGPLPSVILEFTTKAAVAKCLKEKQYKVAVDVIPRPAMNIHFMVYFAIPVETTGSATLVKKEVALADTLAGLKKAGVPYVFVDTMYSCVFVQFASEAEAHAAKKRLGIQIGGQLVEVLLGKPPKSGSVSRKRKAVGSVDE